MTLQVVDHWALCDPFSSGKLVEKKLKPGQTFKVPIGAGQAGTKKRKRKVPEKKAPATPISEFVQTRGERVFWSSFFLFFSFY